MCVSAHSVCVHCIGDENLTYTLVVMESLTIFSFSGAAIGTVLGPAGTAAGAVLGSSAVTAIIAGTTAVGGVVGGAVGAAANKICNIQ